jgi:type I restriction enzyme M protein
VTTDSGADNADLPGLAFTATAKPGRDLQRSAVLGNKSMEQMLWGAACAIRGEKDAPKFKDYLLPLVFLKRLSDVFDDEVARLTQTYGDAETATTLIEADHALVRFYLPPEARWPVFSGLEPFAWPKDKKPVTQGEHVTTATRAVARQNTQLLGIIDQVDFNHVGAGGEREISDSALRGVIEILSDPRYCLGLTDVEPDFLGRCYEYLLRKFAEGAGQSAGEFFTPHRSRFPHGGNPSAPPARGCLRLRLRFRRPADQAPTHRGKTRPFRQKTICRPRRCKKSPPLITPGPTCPA